MRGPSYGSLFNQLAGVVLERSLLLRNIATRNSAASPANPGNPTSSAKPAVGSAVGVGVGDPAPPAIASAVCVICATAVAVKGAKVGNVVNGVGVGVSVGSTTT